MREVKPLVLFSVGGAIYIMIEMLWRGYSHWSMLIVGGLCFVMIGLINEYYSYDMPLIRQMMIGACIVTAVEFVSGCIINLWLGWNVWDYSDMPFNIGGQVCLPYMVLWFLLSGVAIVLDDYLRYWWFEEEKPRYIIWGKFYV